DDTGHDEERDRSDQRSDDEGGYLENPCPGHSLTPQTSNRGAYRAKPDRPADSHSVECNLKDLLDHLPTGISRTLVVLLVDRLDRLAEGSDVRLREGEACGLD